MKVGLAVGLGTGPELAAVFGRALQALAAQHGRRVELVTSEHRYQTFGGQLAELMPATEVARLADEDAEHYERFVTDLHRAGARVIFRTAINAQPLYLVRERLQAIKLERLGTRHGELLLVRDCAQGFYGGVNDAPGTEGVLRRQCEFRRDTTWRILDRALAEATVLWGGREHIDRIQMIYKFHLLDMRLANWINEYARRHGLEIHVCQPDTANRELARDSWRGNVLLIGANEWSDIMHAELVFKLGHGVQEERFSRNVYLCPDVYGMEEYQTVHGSADDIAGSDLVNPLATLRAAADLAERHIGCEGAAAAMETALLDARRSGLVTRDMGGETGTESLVAHVLARCAATASSNKGSGARAGRRAAPRSRDALVLLDLQNDYCAPDGCFHRLGLIEPEAMRPIAEAAARLADQARAAGALVVHVHTLQGEDLPATMRNRNHAQGRDTCVRPGSWGAKQFGPRPQPGDLTVVKYGYDPFLNTSLERDLRERGIECLIVAGVFTDICVDACARTGYQLGFELVVARDATLPLERPLEASLKTMERYYNARIFDAEAAAALFCSREPETASTPSYGQFAMGG